MKELTNTYKNPVLLFQTVCTCIIYPYSTISLCRRAETYFQETIDTGRTIFSQSNLLYKLSRNEAPDISFQTAARSNSPTVEPSLPQLFSLRHDHSTLCCKLWEKRHGKLCCYWLESSIPEWAGYWYYQWDNTKKPSPPASNLPRFFS